MASMSYERRRGEIATYFDHTAVEAWSRLTSDAPVSRIRATVRAGRDAMRETLLSWLPDDLSGRRLLDAGCGTGVLAVEAACRGADVTAVDLSPKLIALARERMPQSRQPKAGKIEFLSGDMLSDALGRFDHVVAMDSLIHYQGADIAAALSRLAERTDHSLLFTYAPRTRLLAMMHAIGKVFPQGDRAPSIVPIAADRLRELTMCQPGCLAFRWGRGQHVASGFYKSFAQEMVHL